MDMKRKNKTGETWNMEYFNFTHLIVQLLFKRIFIIKTVTSSADTVPHPPNGATIGINNNVDKELLIFN